MTRSSIFSRRFRVFILDTPVELEVIEKVRYSAGIYSCKKSTSMNGRQWRSFLGRTGSYFLLQGCFKCIGVLFEDTVQFTRSSVVAVGFSFMFLMGLAFIIGPIISCLMDIFSYKFLGTIGSVLVGVGFICQAFFADSFWKLLIANITSGFGVGVVSFVTMVDLAENFRDQFGVVLSISTLISTIAMMLMPLLVDYWLQDYGLSWTVALLGALMWNTVPCSMLLDTASSIWKCASHQNTAQHQEMAELEGASSYGRTDEGQLQDKLRRKRNILIAHPSLTFVILTRLFNTMILFGWAIYLVPFGISKGYSPSTAVFLSSSGGAGIFLGKAYSIAVFHFEWMHSLPILIGSVVASFSLMVCFHFAESFPFLCSLCLVAGSLLSFNGSWVEAYTIYAVCQNHFKTALGLSNFVTGAGIVSTGIISGLVHDIRGSYNDVFIFLSFMAACQVISLVPAVLLVGMDNCDL